MNHLEAALYQDQHPEDPASKRFFDRIGFPESGASQDEIGEWLLKALVSRRSLRLVAVALTLGVPLGVAGVVFAGR